jgi:hypothetical protein
MDDSMGFYSVKLEKSKIPEGAVPAIQRLNTL